MSMTKDFDRAARAWLDDGPTQLSDRALDATLAQIHLTRQRRALRVPWRFVQMPALSRATAIAAVALVVVVGAGSVMYLASHNPGGAGGPKPSATAAPTTPPTLPPGIPGWSSYTSPVYGLTFSYPSDWRLLEAATHKWQPNEPVDGPPYADLLVTPGEDGAGLGVWQFPAPEGSNLASWEGLRAMSQELCGTNAHLAVTCAAATSGKPMCRGPQGCQAALLVEEPFVQSGLVGDPATGIVTVFQVFRADSHAATRSYGGTIALLKAILGEFDVREPRPGETAQ